MSALGRHRAGDPADAETGTIPLIDGLLVGVEAEAMNAIFSEATADACQAYAAAMDHLATARKLVREARELRAPSEGGK